MKSFLTILESGNTADLFYWQPYCSLLRIREKKKTFDQVYIEDPRKEKVLWSAVALWNECFILE